MDNRPSRADIDARYKWDLTRLYPDAAAWEQAFAGAQEAARDFSRFSGTLAQGREAALRALDAYVAMTERVEDVGLYASLRRSEDSADPEAQAMDDRARALASRAMEASAFLVPQLQALGEDALRAMAEDPAFSAHDAFLRDALRMRAHTLPEEGERLLAGAQEIAWTPGTAYDMLTQADLDLGLTRGEDGGRVRLTDARFLSLLSSGDRAVRRAAYQNMMAGYGKLGHAISALYAGQVKADLYESRARGYESARQASLYPNDIDEQVYDSLIDAVRGGLGTLGAYLSLRREQLGLARLHLYDLYAGETGGFTLRMGIEEAFATFLEAVRPLGEDYVRDASRALPERWIDVYETKNKASGAFCAGGVSHETPYVLLNHKDDYDGLSTLCHEMGHAMHSLYSRRAQPYAKANYALFAAEVASTVNEVLLFEHLRARYADDARAQRMLIGQMLEHFRTTVFRQTMFAEFEHRAHEAAARGESLTRDALCETYLSLNRDYYGGACVVDDAVRNEWMRIPHFYTPYYVYQYATGFCAAVALARRILSGDAEKVAAYRQFLTLGGSLPPLDELAIAGVDMRTPQPVCEALDYFAELLPLWREAGEQDGGRA